MGNLHESAKRLLNLSATVRNERRKELADSASKISESGTYYTGLVSGSGDPAATHIGTQLTDISDKCEASTQTLDDIANAIETYAQKLLKGENRTWTSSVVTGVPITASQPEEPPDEIAEGNLTDDALVFANDLRVAEKVAQEHSPPKIQEALGALFACKLAYEAEGEKPPNYLLRVLTILALALLISNGIVDPSQLLAAYSASQAKSAFKEDPFSEIRLTDGQRVITSKDFEDDDFRRKYLGGLTLDDIEPLDSNFRAVIIFDEKKRTITVAFKGTTRLEDWKANAEEFLTGNSAYYNRAVGIAKKLDESVARLNDAEENDGIQPFQLSFTGHSLGGGMAAVAAAATGRPATVFNPAPVSKKRLAKMLSEDKTIDSSRITSWIVEGEALEPLRGLRKKNRDTRTPGTRNVLPSNESRLTLISKSVSYHGMNELHSRISDLFPADSSM